MCFVKPPQIGGDLKCFAAIRKCANERLLCKFKSGKGKLAIMQMQIIIFVLLNMSKLVTICKEFCNLKSVCVCTHGSLH